ncbi:glycoside hydrolase family 26 protein [Paenibacillus gorillae]|uniref:glycoside hydrolase family 26 protein n=1 Tax=Paenibacillus gorillae TaxID=1243662 RepID=UPI0006935E74|nr:glycosyl hydrolase [Paenibacillus gorillae]
MAVIVRFSQKWQKLMALGMVSVLLFVQQGVDSVKYKEWANPAMTMQEAGEEAAEGQPWTVRFTSKGYNYTLAKAEPETGAYLGAYVLQDREIGYSMGEFNRRTGKKHASYFKYVGYGEPFPAEWVEQVKNEGAFPHIAWEPNSGLDTVKDDEYLHAFAKSANDADVAIFLRFASEMNGTWTAYSGNAERYIGVWRMVHDVLEAEAPQVAMVWTVLNVPELPIESFYPGDAYVDWVGLNVYNVKYHNGNNKQEAHFEDPLMLLDYVYNLFSRRKPIQLSEYGATHFTTVDGVIDLDFAAGKIRRLYESLPELYPRVKAVYYFDVNNLTEYNESRRVNNYAITADDELLEAYRSVIANDHYLSSIHSSPKDKDRTISETFSYCGFIFRKDGVLYADETLFTKLLNVQFYPLGAGGEQAVLTRWISSSDTLKTAQVDVMRHKIWSGYKMDGTVPINRKLNALPLLSTAKSLGYKVKVNGTNINIRE